MKKLLIAILMAAMMLCVACSKSEPVEEADIDEGLAGKESATLETSYGPKLIVEGHDGYLVSADADMIYFEKDGKPLETVVTVTDEEGYSAEIQNAKDFYDIDVDIKEDKKFVYNAGQSVVTVMPLEDSELFLIVSAPAKDETLDHVSITVDGDGSVHKDVPVSDSPGVGDDSRPE